MPCCRPPHASLYLCTAGHSGTCPRSDTKSCTQQHARPTCADQQPFRAVTATVTLEHQHQTPKAKPAQHGFQQAGSLALLPCYVRPCINCHHSSLNLLNLGVEVRVIPHLGGRHLQAQTRPWPWQLLKLFWLWQNSGWCRDTKVCSGSNAGGSCEGQA